MNVIDAWVDEWNGKMSGVNRKNGLGISGIHG